MRTPKLLTLPLLTLLIASLAGCEFFDEDGATFTAADDTTEEDTGPPPPPSTGFRVFPKFMLESIPAIVTIEIDQDPMTCELDGDPGGGYVCDASDEMSAQATIRVDRNGFETAIRHPEISVNQISALDVHLAVEGGATGVWSACTAAAGVVSCDVVCEAQMSTCAVASCDTGQPEFPIATVQTFDDLECLVAVDDLAPACDVLPIMEAVKAIRCCCAD